MEEKSNSDIVEPYKRYRILFFWNAHSWNNILNILYKHKNWELALFRHKIYHYGCDAPDFEIVIWANEYPAEFSDKLESCTIYNVKENEDIYKD